VRFGKVRNGLNSGDAGVFILLDGFNKSLKQNGENLREVFNKVIIINAGKESSNGLNSGNFNLKMNR
jgi:hypothetical protein